MPEDNTMLCKVILWNIAVFINIYCTSNTSIDYQDHLSVHYTSDFQSNTPRPPKKSGSPRYF